MIVSLLQQTQTQLNAYNQFLDDNNQATHLNATLDSLRNLDNAVAVFALRYLCVRSRLDTLLPADFNSRIKAVRQRLLDSEVSFGSTSFQVAALKRVQDELNKLSQELATCWYNYVNKSVQQVTSLYEMLAELPEVSHNRDSILQVFRRLQTQATTVPQSQTQLATLDEDLRQVTSILTGVDGLTPTIRDFLNRVHHNAFTLADLNDEILAWCSVNNRGRSFRIRV